MKEKKPKVEWSLTHIYNVDDKVEFTWLGDICHGTVTELTSYMTDESIKIATYKLKDMYDTTVYPLAGINNNVKMCNILKKII